MELCRAQLHESSSGFSSFLIALCPQGLNARKYHSFHTEDFIGRVKTCAAVTSQKGLESITLQRWYTGSLALSCP